MYFNKDIFFDKYRKMTAEEDEYIKVIREKHSIQEQAKIFYETVLLKKTEMKNLKKEIENVLKYKISYKI